MDIPQGDATYDAARANMGVRWRMFTETQGNELMNNTIRTWVTLNGVNGGKFTSKKDSTKYIFLPAGGAWDATKCNRLGSANFYWTTGYYSSSQASLISFESNNSASVGFQYRYSCQSVRANIFQSSYNEV